MTQRLSDVDRPGLPPLPPSTILVVEVGSTAHGTGIKDGEDHDETAVVVEPLTQVVGPAPATANTMHRTQPDGTRSGPGDTDRNLYSLRSFARLALAGNPSILMALWAPVLYADHHGRALQAAGPAFVGRHVIDRYRGYMRRQAERLLGVSGGGHGARGGGRRPEFADLPYDGKYAMHVARLGFQGIELLTTRRLQLPIAGREGDWLRAVRRCDVPFDEWWSTVLDLDTRLAHLANYDRIPAGPDLTRIETILADTHLAHWTR